MVQQQRERLLGWFAPFQSCAVAYSGGVDSAVVAQAAFLALGDRAVAVTGVSASLAEGELEIAQTVARQIGIRHQLLRTDEFSNPNYLRNHGDRCYHCKSELYARLEFAIADWQVDVVVNGANADDAGDYRPGMQAAQEHRVRSPLLECGLTKQQVRELAADWHLPVWDKPAAPCLSSRIAYGEVVTVERLRMVDLAEQFLREQGLRNVRVRFHAGELARVEVPIDQLTQLLAPGVREALVDYLTELGFKFVTLDLAGFRSGSLNSLVSLSAAHMA